MRLSEEKFYKAFHSSPDAITITRLHDGQLVDVNEGFLQLTGYSKSVALASSSINLRIWVNAQDRDMCIQALQENGSIHDCEYDFRTVSGKILHCLYSGEIIQLNGESHVLSVVQDITERKQAEAALQRVTEDLRRRSIVLEALHQVALDLVNRHNMDEILQTLLERTVSLLGVQQVSIDLIENGDTIVTYAATPGQPLTKGDRMRRGEGGCLSWHAIDTGQPAIVEDYSSWSQRRELFEGFSLYAVAIIPIPRENRIIGAINITRTVSKEPFS